MTTYRIGGGFTVHTITAEEVRAEQVRLWGEEKVAANEADVARRFRLRPMIVCAADGCGMEFFHVPGRGERAPYCLDHADDVFGRQS